LRSIGQKAKGGVPRKRKIKRPKIFRQKYEKAEINERPKKGRKYEK
jgi:hypothetical protein